MGQLLCNWVREEADGIPGAWTPMVDMERYGELLTLLPKHIGDELEKARLGRDPERARYVNGLGYEELLSSVIVDGTAIASSSAEARVVPVLKIPANYLQPGGLPGRTLRGQLRGRMTTLTTGATLTFRVRGEATDVITGTAWGVSGAMVMDATAQTATMWEVEFHIVVRSVGTTGTVFCMGDCDVAAHSAFTAANAALKYIGSAGSATPSTATKDMALDTFLNVTAQWSLATAYSIQSHQYLLEALN